MPGYASQARLEGPAGMAGRSAYCQAASLVPCQTHLGVRGVCTSRGGGAAIKRGHRVVKWASNFYDFTFYSLSVYFVLFLMRNSVKQPTEEISLLFAGKVSKQHMDLCPTLCLQTNTILTHNNQSLGSCQGQDFPLCLGNKTIQESKEC